MPLKIRRYNNARGAPHVFSTLISGLESLPNVCGGKGAITSSKTFPNETRKQDLGGIKKEKDDLQSTDSGRENRFSSLFRMI